MEVVAVEVTELVAELVAVLVAELVAVLVAELVAVAMVLSVVEGSATVAEPSAPAPVHLTMVRASS